MSGVGASDMVSCGSAVTFPQVQERGGMVRASLRSTLAQWSVAEGNGDIRKSRTYLDRFWSVESREGSL